jgi:hypothetical protein
MINVDKFIYGDEDVLEFIVEKHGSHDQSSHGNWATGGVSSGLTQSVLDRVRTNGGLSVNMRNGSEPSSGYMVASPVKKAPIVDADDFYDPIKGRKILGDFVKANKSTLGSGKKYLGLWHNKEDNKVYLDVSENVQDKARAVQLGRERNQISIWDVVNFDEIQTGGTGVTKEGRNSDGRTSIEYLGNDGRPDRQLGGFDLQQNQEVEKHGSHDQSSHAGDRGKGNKTPEGEQEVTDPNAPKPKLKPGRKPDASGTVEQRAEKLANGQRIQVTQKEAKQIMDIMSKREDNPDLTNMHVENTQLYDEDNLGIPRNKMPQVPSNTKAVFISEMEKRGARVQRGVADPAKLHPIQAEMSASKVGLIMKKLREKGTATDDGGRIIISKDNYVIDGHHRWAAASMLSFEDSSVKLPVIRVDMNHKDLIDATLAWNAAVGIKPIGMGESNPGSNFKKWKEFDEIVAKAVRGRTVIRFQPGLKPTLKHLSGQHDQSTHGTWAGYKQNDAASWGEERAKVLDKTSGGPSVAQLNKFFDMEANVDADNYLESMKPNIKKLYSDDIRGKDGMLYKIEIDDENIQMSTNADAKYRKIFVEGTINSMDGNYAGVFQRAIYRDLNTKGIIVSHELLELEPEVQGLGIGAKFYMNAENKYIVNGYEKIAVHAALDQGGYVWAKTGFGWDDGTGLSESGREAYRNQMVQRWRDMGENDAQVYEVLSNDVSTRTRFNDLVDNLEQKSIDAKDYPTPYELATFKSSTGEKIGKVIMQNSNWHGVKYLTPSGKKRNQ